MQGGGCSGLSYLFKSSAKPRPTDKVFEFEGVKIFVDPKSMVYLDGMTLDYKESLIHSGFVFENPNAKKSCGCGTSFIGLMDVPDYFQLSSAWSASCALDAG